MKSSMTENRKCHLQIWDAFTVRYELSYLTPSTPQTFSPSTFPTFFRHKYYGRRGGGVGGGSGEHEVRLSVLFVCRGHSPLPWAMTHLRSIAQGSHPSGPYSLPPKNCTAATRWKVPHQIRASRSSCPPHVIGSTVHLCVADIYDTTHLICSCSLHWYGTLKVAVKFSWRFVMIMDFILVVSELLISH